MDNKKRVVIGLSGGVDSAVSAYLLLRQGYEVIGLFMRNWDSLINNEKNYQGKDLKICQQEQDYNDAKLVADKLKIKLYRVDFIKEYWKEVFLPFIDAYKKSITPNPDVFCNKFIKFKYFTNYAFKTFNADFVATGHYAKNLVKDNVNYLQMAKDLSKDQTYFLSGLNSKQLQNIIFPLGDLTKIEVRQIAKEKDLIVAEKKDSTGICFIGKRKIKDFLLNYIPKKPGDFIDIDSKQILGNHDGTMFYTIGQRFGLNIGGLKKPVFVVKKDIAKNIVFVSNLAKTNHLISHGAILNDVSWINKPPLPGKYQAKFKHSPAIYDVEIVKFISDQKLQIAYQDLSAITPGQNCVFYHNDICLGQGKILKTL